jgi:hypothetical protein
MNKTCRKKWKMMKAHKKSKKLMNNIKNKKINNNNILKRVIILSMNSHNMRLKAQRNMMGMKIIALKNIVNHLNCK